MFTRTAIQNQLYDPLNSNLKRYNGNERMISSAKVFFFPIRDMMFHFQY